MDDRDGHVLLIEDDRVFARCLSAYLSARRLRVSVAEDAFQGYRSALRERPDLIILDHYLPAGTGLTVLARLKSTSQTSTVPVIYLTGADDAEIGSEAARLGAAVVLFKSGLSESALLGAVEEAVGRREDERQIAEELFPGGTNATGTPLTIPCERCGAQASVKMGSRLICTLCARLMFRRSHLRQEAARSG